MARQVYIDFTSDEPRDCPHCGQEAIAASYYRKHIKTHKCLETKNLRRLKAMGYVSMPYGARQAFELVGVDMQSAAHQPGRPRSGTHTFVPKWAALLAQVKSKVPAREAQVWMHVLKQAVADKDFRDAILAMDRMADLDSLVGMVREGTGRCDDGVRVSKCRDKELLKQAKLRRRTYGRSVTERASSLVSCQDSPSTPEWW
jgi:hypothetical protein